MNPQAGIHHGFRVRGQAHFCRPHGMENGRADFAGRLHQRGRVVSDLRPGPVLDLFQHQHHLQRDRDLCRVAAGIVTTRRAYQQSALVLNLAQTRPHHDTSTEFHTESGPFTLVPLPGRRSSLVCVLDPAGAAELFATEDKELAVTLEQRAHSILGPMQVEPGRGLFPLAVETARSFARDRIALVGEAAHVVPPIGAQGLNLGLRDAATLAEIVADARREGTDVGSPGVRALYEMQRRADVTSRRIGIDLLNRSLLADFLAIQGVRGLSLFLVDRIGPLRRALMREGVAPAASQPRLMRGEMV